MQMANKVTLKNIASFSKGEQINGDLLLKDGAYPYLNGGINPSGMWNECNVDGNTVTISEGGNSCGYVNYMDSPFWCGAHCYYLYDVKCDIKFLYHALKSSQDRLMSLRSGACMPNIKKKDLGEFEIPEPPPLAIQREIAYNLDKVSEAIEQCRKILEKLDYLVKAKFAEMFGDPESGDIRYPQKDLASLSIKISDGVHAKPDYTPVGKPFLSVMNLSKGEIDFNNCKYVSDEAYSQMIKSTHPEKGDVLYTKVGTYGIPAYVDTEKAFCLYVSVCLIKPNHDLINSKFLAIQMSMPFIKHQADKRIKGIGVPDLHLNQINQFQILCPPRELQNQFVDYVYKIDRAKAAVKKTLEKAQVLKAALMQKYFG